MQKTMDGRRLWGELLGQFVIKVELERLKEAIEDGSPARLVTIFGQEELDCYAFGCLFQRERERSAVGEAYGRGAIVRTKSRAQLAASPVELVSEAVRAKRAEWLA